jgi:hypothetical protein
MNILPHVPTLTVFNAGIVNTEAVRKDNTQREAVPQLAANENSASETGVGSDSDKVKTPGQSPLPTTYEKSASQTGQQLNTQNDPPQDNGQDASAGKENAKDRQQQQAEQQQLTELKERDTEVRMHEQAHASLGGQYASSPQYEYERGPDGRRYVVDGKVSIDVSKASTPEETIRKALQVKAAALAPAEPSTQDLRVAIEATQIALEARTEIATEKAEKAQESYIQAIPDAIDVGIPTRSLDITQSMAVEQRINELDVDGASPLLENRDLEITRRVSVIEKFYQQVTNPRADGLQMSA